MHSNVRKLLNNQYNSEMAAATMMFEYSARIDEYGMDHFSALLYDWAKEKLEHAQKLEWYLRLNEQWIRTNELATPKLVDSTEPLGILEAVSEYQRATAVAFDEIAEVALINKDFGTYNFVGFFIENQLYQKKKCSDLINTFKMSEDLLIIDEKIKQIKEEHLANITKSHK
ncbi:ferritin [Mycoplasmoides gallisepticum S6]|uniref:Ferritin n=1 Tax=Mycoplasmoides gallisepticum S6 TaxID=1006581 RepID=A0A0F6CJS5_MYCGL|nr:ferritin-like domain-containing protein [Mycoplasmoides gallisepticum]AHB99347.1 ferritin [Mycoplasmoides gallisepticum S6]